MSFVSLNKDYDNDDENFDLNWSHHLNYIFHHPYSIKIIIIKHDVENDLAKKS